MAREGSGQVDLLHVNCEGCEWEMMENILNTQGLMGKVGKWEIMSSEHISRMEMMKTFSTLVNKG